MADTANAPQGQGQPAPAQASSAAPRMCTLRPGHETHLGRGSGESGQGVGRCVANRARITDTA